MVKAVKGVLVQCDASIKAIIMKIDAGTNEYILEELDDETLLVKDQQLPKLQAQLKEQLKNTVKEAEESGSD